MQVSSGGCREPFDTRAARATARRCPAKPSEPCIPVTSRSSWPVALRAAVLQPDIGFGRRELALLAVFCWSVGVFLYVGVGILVVIRLLLYPLAPEDLIPPYWVAMGATAITVLAGARIVEMVDAPMVVVMGGLTAGTSVMFWAFGSWLIPPLLAGGVGGMLFTGSRCAMTSAGRPLTARVATR